MQGRFTHDLQRTNGHGQFDRCQAIGIGCFGGKAQHGALFVSQLDRAGLAGDAQRRAGFKLHLHLLRAAGKVCQIQRNRGAVAGGNKTRHRQLGHQRRGHHHLGIGTGIAVGRAGHGHQAQRAVEVGQRQLDGGFALRVERDRATEQINQPHFFRQALGVAFAGIATKPLLGLVAVHLLDQLAIKIQQVGTVAMFAEEKVARVGRGVARDVEDADINRRQRHDGLTALEGLARRVGEPDLDRHFLLGHGLGRGADGELELARLARQRQMHQAQRPRRGDALALAAGAKGGHCNVQVVPVPGRVYRDLDGGAAGYHLHALLVQHAVALDGDQRLAVVRRGDGQAGFVAGLERCAFEFEADAIRAVTHVIGILRAPAGVEAVACRLPRGRVQQLQPVAAIGHGKCNLAARRKRKAARLHQLFLGVVAAVPAAAVVIAPIPLPLFTHQTQLQRRGGGKLAVASHPRQLELGQAALLRHVSLKQGPQADQHRSGPPTALDGAHHRAAARFEQAEAGAQLHGRLALGQLQRHADFCLAIFVQAGLTEVLPLAGAVVIKVAENKARPALRQRQALPFNRHAGEQSIAPRRRTVKVIAFGLHRQCAAALQRCLGRFEVQLHAFG